MKLFDKSAYRIARLYDGMAVCLFTILVMVLGFIVIEVVR